MIGRNDIIGYTLAEIALLLLFATVAVLLPQYSRLSMLLKGAITGPDANRIRVENARLHDENAKLKKQLEQTKPGESAAGLRSKQTPSCIEKKLANGPLFSAIALPNGRYRVGSETLDISEIKSRYEKDLSFADANQCRQRVQLGYTRDMTADQYYQAQVQLESLFYVGKVAGH